MICKIAVQWETMCGYSYFVHAFSCFMRENLKDKGKSDIIQPRRKAYGVNRIENYGLLHQE